MKAIAFVLRSAVLMATFFWMASVPYISSNSNLTDRAEALILLKGTQ